MTELAAERSNVRVSMVQLPGLNTPQFTWNLNKMPGHPRPVAPVFQPELAARAIRFLVEHRRRSLWVGVSRAYTILGERVAPLLVRAYLARTGVSGQQADADLPCYGSNVFEPSDDEVDRGAHGPFDDQSYAATRCPGRPCTARPSLPGRRVWPRVPPPWSDCCGADNTCAAFCWGQRPTG